MKNLLKNSYHPTKEKRVLYLENNSKIYQGYELCHTYKEEEVFLAYNFGARIEIDLYRLDTHLFDGFAMMLYASRSGKDEIFVHDITGKRLQGYGTLIIQKLIAFAKKEKINKIYGDFYSLDLSNHKDLLLHFYSKFGATCSLNSAQDGGEFELVLNTS